jgi:hypothetical protein
VSYNKPDRTEVQKEAEKQGYSWNSDKTKMVDGKGGELKFSETGQSANLNGSHYNSVSDIKKSKQW